MQKCLKYESKMSESLTYMLIDMYRASWHLCIWDGFCIHEEDPIYNVISEWVQWIKNQYNFNLHANRYVQRVALSTFLFCSDFVADSSNFPNAFLVIVHLAIQKIKSPININLNKAILSWTTFIYRPWTFTQMLINSILSSLNTDVT